jgi:hypothetical protein
LEFIFVFFTVSWTPVVRHNTLMWFVAFYEQVLFIGYFLYIL